MGIPVRMCLGKAFLLCHEPFVLSNKFTSERTRAIAFKRLNRTWCVAKHMSDHVKGQEPRKFEVQPSRFHQRQTLVRTDQPSLTGGIKIEQTKKVK